MGGSAYRRQAIIDVATGRAEIGKLDA